MTGTVHRPMELAHAAGAMEGRRLTWNDLTATKRSPLPAGNPF